MFANPWKIFISQYFRDVSVKGKFVYPVGTSFARAYGSAECQRSKIVEVPPIVLPMGICNTNIIYRKAPSNFPVITNLELPNFRKVKEISSPNVSRGIIGDPSKPFARIEAARMIVIRKRKMRKHKLKKLRKRMKFVFERIRMRREQRKEKVFQGELMSMVRSAEAFDPKTYVSETIKRATYTPKLEDVLPPRPTRRTFEKPNIAFKMPLLYKNSGS
ncbi:uncharacterized protein LOC136028798 [Artemia franciscana]|uniref:Ribosomal protein mS38 C-terminal domain-containing protein n=1 Tax=Artemia franciscana TaxID=6661 RepID=A0AA88IRZ9_ARTSF|nr:hypothetical protein QYM36_007437 [Artemia franciscana]